MKAWTEAVWTVEGVVVIYFCPFCCVLDPKFWSDGSGSSRTKLSHRKKNEGILCFYMLASDLAWASFMEVKFLFSTFLFIKTLDLDPDPQLEQMLDLDPQ
jgi:hypothetical protein